MTSRPIRTIVIIASALALTILAFARLIWPVLLPSLIYSPRAMDVARTAPESWGYSGEAVRLPATGAVAILAWRLRHTSPRSNACVVLFTHGNAGNISVQAGFMRPFLAEGFDAVVFDYRGYGASGGQPSEEHLYEDADLVYRYLRENDIAPDHLLLVGHSLGTAVASHLASTRAVAGLILAAPFTSLPDAMHSRLPWLPVRLLRRESGRFDAKSRITKISAPTLFVVGADDGIVPSSSSRELFEEARSTKRWVEVPGGHNDVFRGTAFEQALANFRTLLPSCGAPATTSHSPRNGTDGSMRAAARAAGSSRARRR
jgi:pimeloyl-ACP methyl ester carboxylesterase